jgi:hypothetical protein
MVQIPEGRPEQHEKQRTLKVSCHNLAPGKYAGLQFLTQGELVQHCASLQ